MIRKNKRLDRFYKKLLAKERIPYKKAARIYESLYKEAVSLRAVSSKNIHDGLEVDLRVAGILNRLI